MDEKNNTLSGGAGGQMGGIEGDGLCPPWPYGKNCASHSDGHPFRTAIPGEQCCPPVPVRDDQNVADQNVADQNVADQNGRSARTVTEATFALRLDVGQSGFLVRWRCPSCGEEVTSSIRISHLTTTTAYTHYGFACPRCAQLCSLPTRRTVTLELVDEETMQPINPPVPTLSVQPTNPSQTSSGLYTPSPQPPDVGFCRCAPAVRLITARGGCATCGKKLDIR